MAETENPFITIRAAPLIRAIEDLRALHGISDHELCRSAGGLKSETLRRARDNPARVSEQTLQKLFEGLTAAIASKQGQQRDTPWFPLAADVLTYADLRGLANEADAQGRSGTAENLRTHARRPAYRRSDRRGVGSYVFTASAITWLQYQWVIEIACREFRLKSANSLARAIALFLCVEEFNAPQSLLAGVADMTEPSVIEAITRMKAALQGKGRRASDIAALTRCIDRLRGALSGHAAKISSMHSSATAVSKTLETAARIAGPDLSADHIEAALKDCGLEDLLKAFADKHVRKPNQTGTRS